MPPTTTPRQWTSLVTWSMSSRRPPPRCGPTSTSVWVSPPCASPVGSSPGLVWLHCQQLLGVLAGKLPVGSLSQVCIGDVVGPPDVEDVAQISVDESLNPIDDGGDENCRQNRKLVLSLSSRRFKICLPRDSFLHRCWCIFMGLFPLIHFYFVFTTLHFI